MQSAKVEYYQKSVVENAKWVDSILLAGFTVAGMTILVKLSGASEVSFREINFSTNSVWIVLAVLSIAHIYTAWLLSRSIHQLWSTKNEEKCLETFREVTSSGGLFVRGLEPRVAKTDSKSGTVFYKMRFDDPSAWAAHLFIIIAFASIVPYQSSKLLSILKYTFVAFFIIIINWQSASDWVIGLSELAIPHEKSTFLARRRTTFREWSKYMTHSLLFKNFDYGEPSILNKSFAYFAPLILPLSIVYLLIMFFVLFIWPLGYGAISIFWGLFLIPVMKVILNFQSFGKTFNILLIILTVILVIIGLILMVR